MYKTVVIPLDLSDMAEKTLPYLPYLAAPQTSRLIFVHTIEPQQYAFGSIGEQPEIFTKLLSSLEQNATAHLTALRDRFQDAGYAVTIHVAQGDAAQFIVDIAVAEDADLIAMTTHGRTGFARWALGSVADRVIRSAHHPVFVVRSEMDIPVIPTLRRILVPLDGSSLAETGLQQAQQIAVHTGATLLLLRVIAPLTPWEKQMINRVQHPATQFSSGYTATSNTLATDVADAVTDTDSDTLIDTDTLADTDTVAELETVEHAQRYLDNKACQLRTAGISSHQKLYTGSPAEAILKVATEEQVDLIVMNTHGYGGYTRWVYGSIANRVLHDTPCPLLLNRALPKEATLLL